MAELLINQHKDVKTFLVKDSEWGKAVVKKVLDKTNLTVSEISQFHHEFDLLESIDVKGVRKNLRAASEDGKPVLYFEYFEGFTIKQIIASGSMPPAGVVNSVLSIVDTLAVLHDIKLVHKNINSNNLLMNPETGDIQIIDFTYASKITEKRHLLGNPDVVEGNLAYISPEQTGRMNRQTDTRSDLYSLGVVMFEMLTGRLPFLTQDPLEMIHSHLALRPPEVRSVKPGVPVILDLIVGKLLNKNPEERYQSATGLLSDLRKIHDHYKKQGEWPEFLLGEYDVSPILHLSQKLYGRHKEINLLRELFQQVVDGPARLVMINGYSGVGKTAVVHEVFSDISRKNGYFIKGKFDQLQRNMPYYAIASAFREYVNYVVTQDDDEITLVRKLILEAVDKEAWVLTDLIPSLEMIIGKQEEGERLSGMEAQNRFNYVFGRFLKSISRPDNPIVLFIDDLQWADSSSLNLLYNLLRDRNLKHLLFAGSYRSNEIGKNHPLRALFINLSAEVGPIPQIEIGNLSINDIDNLLKDSLQKELTAVSDLSAIIFEKTHGNPFHVKQVIKLLYEKDILFLDTEKSAWSWVPEKVRKLDLTENVIDVLAMSLQRLDEKYLRILQTASCIGNSFKKDYLEIIDSDHKDLVNKALQKAQEEGYIYYERGQYHFIHDRIQQTIYSLLQEDQKAGLHLRIGEVLLENLQDDLDENIFDIVNQLNEGIDLLEDEGKKEQFGRLNLLAGQKARTSSAFNSAYEYAGYGVRLLNDRWPGNHELQMALHILAAESAYLIGRYDEADTLLNPVRDHSTSALEVIPADAIKIEALKAQNKLVEAIDHGIQTLKSLHIDLPGKPVKWKILLRLLSVRISLAGRKIENLKDLPEMTHPEKLAAMHILVAIGPAIYWAAPELIPNTIFEMVLLSVRHGNTDESVFAYSTYALFLSGVTGELSSGRKFSELALHLAARASMENRVKGVFNVFCFVHHWTNPVADSLRHFEENFKLGMEAGDLEFAALSAYLFCNHQLYAGTNLDQVDQSMSLYSNEIRLIRQDTPYNYLLIHWQAVKNLKGESADPMMLAGEAYDERHMVGLHQNANDRTALFKYYLQKMILSYYFEAYDQAGEYGKMGITYIQAATGMLVTAVFWFFYGLVQAKIVQDDKNGDLKILKQAISKFKKWAHYSPVNHGHKYEMLRAEYARLRGDFSRAKVHLDSAISQSEKNGFVQEQALANLLSGKFFIDQGNQQLGQYYLINAYILFKRWGADALCNDLRYKYQLDQSVGYYFDNLNSSFQLAGQRNAFENIDFRSIMKAATAISSELEYKLLIDNLLKVLIENSGAQRGIFIGLVEEELKPEGQWPAPEGNENFVFPEKLVRWVYKTGESINLSNAREDPTWGQDPYLLAHEVKSVLCFSVKYQAVTAGMVYLENNITYGTFTDEREELMQLLSGQIATAIRNASLYKDLENTLDEQVALKEAYSKFIPKNILQFLGKESILDVDLGDQIQENVSIMFMDIMDYTQLSESMTPRDNFNFINGYLKRVGPHIEKNGGFICQFLGDGFMAIFKERAEEALQAAILIQHEIIAYNKARKKQKRKPVQVGIGVHHGPVMLGIIGDRLRMDQNVISDHVNIASRIQGLTRFYGASIVLSGLLLEKIHDLSSFHLRKLGKVVLKGKKEEIEVIECIDGLPAREQDARARNLDRFNEGMMHYYNKNFSHAAMNFEEVLKDDPQDKAARYYLNKSALFITDGIPGNWTGVEVMETK